MRTMKATLESDKCGGKNAARHNDRSFDVSKAENIGDIRLDTVTFFPNGGEPKKVPLERRRLEKLEEEYYRSRFGSSLDAQRERHLKARHKDRAEGCTAERYYNSQRTCPTSIIFQIGKEGEYKDRKTFIKALKEAIRAIEEGNEDARIKVLSIAVHGSETSLHAHMRLSFEVRGKDGWEVNQEKCLEKLGYKLPDEEKKKGRYNNRKMSWTEQTRQKWYDTIERVDPEIKIDRTPNPHNPKTRGKVNKALKEMNELKTLIREVENELRVLQREISHLSKDDLQERKERLQKSLERLHKRFGTLNDFVGGNELVDPLGDLHEKETVEEETVEDILGER